jgi:hypothetical protein
VNALSVVEAKAAMFARLQAVNAAGAALATIPIPGLDPEPVDVRYFYPGRSVGRVCVYLGGATFDLAADAVDGDDVLTAETDRFGVYVRVVRPLTDTEPALLVAERLAAAAAGIILGVLADDPKLGPGVLVQATAGALDHVITDDEAIAVLALDIVLYSYP